MARAAEETIDLNMTTGSFREDSGATEVPPSLGLVLTKINASHPRADLSPPALVHADLSPSVHAQAVATQ
jgi:hypothetical protein